MDFKSIRGDSVESKRVHFEQLVCRLAELDNKGGEFRRIHGPGGDGGVEALRLLLNRKKIGYQAKYFTDAVDWSQITASVEMAIKVHPELEQYIIAVPRDFTGRRVHKGKKISLGLWEEWEKHRKTWEKFSPGVTFQLRDAHSLEKALLSPNAAHLIPYFFSDKPCFTPVWMRDALDRTIADLQARYSPEDHVDTEGLRAFDVIFRRENLRRDLSRSFDQVRDINLSELAALPEAAELTEELETTLKVQSRFLKLQHAIDQPLPEALPICEWFSGWYSVTRRSFSVVDRFRDIAATNDSRNTIDQVRNAVSTSVGDQTFSRQWNDLLPIDSGRSVLFIGRAGAGKSHLLATASERAWNQGAPVIHLLGQHIVDHNPRTSILLHLGLSNWQFKDFLSALDLAAEASSTRALLVIDALNEGHGLDIWRNHLAGVVRDVNEFERVVLVLSCREEYLPFVVSQELIAAPHPYPKDGQLPHDCRPLGKVVPVSVEGFRLGYEREAALKQFMDAKGISRPTVPVLDEEFFNPLFFTSVCRSMQRAGMTVFPRGLRGTAAMFDFVLETKIKSLGTRYDGTPRLKNALVSALDEFSRDMVSSKQDSVGLMQANNILREQFSPLPLESRTWLEVLEGSDIFRCDVERDGSEILPLSRPIEVIRFSFQRLQEYLVAGRMMKDCADIDQSFAPNSPFDFMLDRYSERNGKSYVRPAHRWAGLLGAVWTAVAESQGRELFDIPSFFRGEHLYLRDFQPVFNASVRERRGDAFSLRTLEILNLLWQDEQEEKLQILLGTACVPNHFWNADLLVTILARFSPEKLHERWGSHFDERSLRDAALQIIDWTQEVDVSAADPEVIRLASLTLACLRFAANEVLKASANAALSRLLDARPNLRVAVNDLLDSLV